MQYSHQAKMEHLWASASFTSKCDFQRMFEYALVSSKKDKGR